MKWLRQNLHPYNKPSAELTMQLRATKLLDLAHLNLPNNITETKIIL